jgi:replicative DNA helicase
MDLIRDNHLEQVALKVLAENPDMRHLFSADMFSTIQHIFIFDKITKAHETGVALDMNLLVSYLDTDGKLRDVGTDLLSKIFSLEYSVEFIPEYAKKLNRLSLLRRSQTSLFTIADKISSYDIPELVAAVDGVRQTIFDEVDITDEDYSLNNLISEELITILDGSSSNYLLTGFKDFDTLIGGLELGDLVIIAARPAVGKCLGKGTKVMLYDGSIVPVEDIRVGDKLMGDDSSPRNVLSITHGKEMMYWVRQLHGVDYRVNESHILSMKRSRTSITYPKGSVVNLSVKEYLNKSNKWKTNYKGYKVAVEFPYQEVLVDPYLLGVWLGDGSSASSSITNKDEEVIDYLKVYADTHSMSLHSHSTGDKCPTHRITAGRSQIAKDNSIQAELRELGVLNNKHIPQSYISNSREIRLQLLAGLIDSDGFVNNGKGQGETIEITSKYKHLAEQIKFLCDTLGYRTAVHEKKVIITSTGFSCTVWRVLFNGNVDEIPTKILRKKCRKWTDIRDWKVTGISVKQDKVDDYYGFELDGNGLFLLEDCTVTHNTSLMLRWMLNMAKAGIRGEIYSFEMSNAPMVRRIMAMESGIPTHRLQKGLISEEEKATLKKLAMQLKPIPLSFRYAVGQNIAELANFIRLSTKVNATKVFAVDYVQQMEITSGNETQDLNKIAKVLKNLAVELNIVIILISQLNRAVESRKNKHPGLSDLRQAGGLEESADLVIFPYREYYYSKDPADTNLAELIVAKNRNGPIADFNLLFDEEVTNFYC